MRRKTRAVLALLLAAGLLGGALGVWIRRGPPVPGDTDGALAFRDVTADSGIVFRHESGARGEKLNPETFGPGCGWLDCDGDGRLDILLVNGNLLRGPLDGSAVPALYRNLGGGRFEDVTRESGLERPFYGMGFAAADVDEDGDADVLLYGLRRSFFYRNAGGGTFEDATDVSGLSALDGWVAAAAFFDYDRDGHLDLFIGNYVDWRPELEDGADCNFGTPEKKYCPVAMFPPSRPQLFRGDGTGKFMETTREAGLDALRGKALGVAVEDYDRDGWPDIFLANDSVPNFLLRNRGDGTFEERGIPSGFATGADGAALAGMGIDTAWTADGGPLRVGIGNFSGEPTTVHVQEDVEFFVERSFSLDVARPTLDSVTFGLAFEDFDLDGELDLLIANGHVFDVEAISRIPYRQRPQLFLGRPDGGFRALEPRAPDALLGRKLLGRGLACADFDEDGDVDVLVTENQGGAYLFRNDAPPGRRSVKVGVEGRESHRDGIGAEVTLHSVRGSALHSRRRTVRAASSYLSQSDRRLVFGLAPGEEVRSLEVRWPLGRREIFEPVAAGKENRLVEGRGRELEPGSSGREVAGLSRESAANVVDSPNSVQARSAGIEHLSAGRFVEALAALDEAIALDGHDFTAWRFRLVALWRLGRAREVESSLCDIAGRFGAAMLVSHFALVLRETGYRELAARVFLEAGRRAPERADIWTSLGNLAYDARDYAAARAHYERALALHPRSLEALDNLGKILALQGETLQAAAYLEKAIALRPDHSSALSTLGGILVQEGDLEKARAYLERALESATSEAAKINAHGNLGGLYLKLGDRARARASFRKVLELDPEDEQARRAIEYLERRSEEK